MSMEKFLNCPMMSSTLVLQARELDQKYFLNYRKLGFVNAKAEYADKFESQISQATEKLKQIVKIAGVKKGHSG